MSDNTSKNCIHLALAACRCALVRGFHSDVPQIEKTVFEARTVKIFFSQSHALLESILVSVLSFPDPPYDFRIEPERKKNWFNSLRN
jgi:hypothetical protein